MHPSRQKIQGTFRDKWEDQTFVTYPSRVLQQVTDAFKHPLKQAQQHTHTSRLRHTKSSGVGAAETYSRLPHRPTGKKPPTYNTISRKETATNTRKKNGDPTKTNKRRAHTKRGKKKNEGHTKNAKNGRGAHKTGKTPQTHTSGTSTTYT